MVGICSRAFYSKWSVAKVTSQWATVSNCASTRYAVLSVIRKFW
uniref:Uncharacterized protein n=1 Tax=Parascaris equorum TaxID=6256 RepID=A0A914SFF8_PAREQ